MEILVVEDEPKMRRLLEEALSEAGYAVRAVEDGADAVALTARSQFDAIVLDVNLPSMNGFEVLRVIRSRQDWTPVLMLTARDAVADRVMGLDGGADDYLIKPFAFTELFSRLRALLRRGSAARPTTLSCGPLRVDPATRVVMVGVVPVDLSSREFELLEFLARHPGQVLSRTVLIERVWGHNFDGYSNVVDVYVRYLRDKIDRPFGLQLIRTVRGAGYQMACPDSP